MKESESFLNSFAGHKDQLRSEKTIESDFGKCCQKEEDVNGWSIEHQLNILRWKEAQKNKGETLKKMMANIRFNNC